MHAFDREQAVILPIHYERTTSYGTGTKNGPREILAASSQVELYDEELGGEICSVGIHTLPAMELPFARTEEAFAEIRRTASWLAQAGKFFVALGGEHALTAPLVAGIADHHAGLSVLQIDAHADLREATSAIRSHASAMRRVLNTPVRGGHPQPVGTRGRGVAKLATTMFYDWNMRDDPDGWTAW